MCLKNKMKTLADVELSQKAITKAERRLNKIKKILGREKELPVNLSKDSILNCGLSEPKEVLKKGGYIDIKRGWIKKIDKGSRFHCYIYEDEFHYKYIYLHRDKTINKKHLAVNDDMVLDEKIRLKQWIKPRINTGKRNVFLSREERLKALSLLTNSAQSVSKE